MENHWFTALLIPVVLGLLFTTFIQAGVLNVVAGWLGIEDVTFWRAYGAYWVLLLIDAFSVWFFGKALGGLLAGVSTMLLGAWFLSYFFSASYGRSIALIIISQIVLFFIVLILIIVLGIPILAMLADLPSLSGL